MTPNVYKGTVPMLPCRLVSGADCEQLVPADAEHCGNPEHVRSTVLPIPKTDGEFISRVRKPRLTVNEDYDLLQPEHDLESDLAMPNLDEATLDTSRLWVGTRVQLGFTAHHGTDAQTAIDELRFLVGEALRNGTYRRAVDGFHHLSYQRFAVSVTPDGGTIAGYSTLHYERTPTQVIGGVRSRFGRRRRSGPRREPGPPLPLPELVAIFDPDVVAIGCTAVSLYAKRSGMDADEEKVEAAMRAELAEAADTGTWKESDRGPTAYVLETPTRCWIVAADGGLVISHYVPDSPSVENP
jgi:hypothetical protein